MSNKKKIRRGAAPLPAGETGWTPELVAKLMANPFYAIDIAPELALPHEPILSEEMWVAANVRAIEEIGAEAWLQNLLSVLQGDYVRGAAA